MEATALAAGVQRRSCTACGAGETRAIAKLIPTGSLNASGTLPLQIKKSVKLKVTGLARGDSVAKWKSSSTKVAKVSASGKVTARKKTGTAVITATLKSGKTLKLKIKVQKAAVKTKKIQLENIVNKKLTIKKGAAVQLQALVQPITSQQKITYATSNKKVAAVNKKGKVTAKKKGKAVITVKSGQKKVKIKVTVTG